MKISNDLQNNAKVQRVIAPVAIGANGTISGKVIDRKGYAGVQILASYGAVTTTGSIVTLVVKEGDATGTMTSVADADLIGTETLASLPVQATARTSEVGKNVSKRVAYKGNKRYVTVDAVKTGTTSVGCVSVEALLFNPEVAPTTNP
jgi:muramoyltetrapeptide carboxypeptidase LdcA involved in peptidoglycan recycling